MYIAFFHAMKYMSLSEYEQIFILIKEKGKFRENNSKASAYVKEKELGEVLTSKSRWIYLTNEVIQNPEIKVAMELQ